MSSMGEERTSSEAFDTAFRRFVNQDYNQLDDDRLKAAGAKILQQHSPTNTAPSSRFNISNIFWIISSIAVFHYTDFYLALRLDPNINRSYLNPGLGMVGISVCIGSYVILYYHYYKGMSDYERHAPFAAPLATISFIIGIICICMGLWPLWSIFTPFILFTLFMGFIIFVTFLPF